LLSLGVSNFPVDLFAMFAQVGTSSPHVVQNLLDVSSFVANVPLVTAAAAAGTVSGQGRRRADNRRIRMASVTPRHRVLLPLTLVDDGGEPVSTTIRLAWRNHLLFQAYSPVRRALAADAEARAAGNAAGSPLLAVLRDVAAATRRTPAVLMLKWLRLHDVGVVARSSNVEHIGANLDLHAWELDDAHVNAITEAAGVM
jgi:diketogulonate reductase-like aldo/keto reductase